MIVILPIYPAWFNDELSATACETLNEKTVRHTEWVTLSDLFSLVLPYKFNIIHEIKADKLSAVYFKPTDEKFHGILLHPDSVFKIVKREARRRIKRE